MICVCAVLCVCVCSHVSAVAYTWRSKNNFHVSFAFCLLGGFCGWLLAPKRPRTFFTFISHFPLRTVDRNSSSHASAGSASSAEPFSQPVIYNSYQTKLKIKKEA